MALLLGIDLGTSYFKVGLFDERGALRGLGRVSVEWAHPAPLHSELEVDEFWRLLREGLGAALAQAGASARAIAAMSYSSQASTFLLLDETDSPLTPLVGWTDTRGTQAEPALAAFAATDGYARTAGMRGLSEYSAVRKWRWFARHAPDTWARTARIMTISDYFTFALTGERAGDASTAALLGILDLSTGLRWPEALAKFELPPEKFSTWLCPGTACGRMAARAAELLGVPAGTPLAVGALDHHAAAIGSGLGTLAGVSLSTGTVLAAFVLADTVEPLAGCHHGPHTDGRRFYRLAFDANGAGELEEFQRTHAPGRSIEELLALAATATTHEGRAVRDILERVATTHARLARKVGAAGAPAIATGGGARSPLWVQLIADALDAQVVTATSPERACLGAAIIAASAAGWHRSSAEAAAAMVAPGSTFEPRRARRFRR